jgi:thioredoxin 1
MKIAGIMLMVTFLMGNASVKNESLTRGSDETPGIQFASLRLEEAKKLAKETGKLIFIDAYTSWCGPCKKMAASTFTDAKVGEVFNERYVNLKIDCELDPDGPEISRLYKIRAYPTLLFIDGDGKIVQSFLGYQTVDQLLTLVGTVK